VLFFVFINVLKAFSAVFFVHPSYCAGVPWPQNPGLAGSIPI